MSHDLCKCKRAFFVIIGRLIVPLQRALWSFSPSFYTAQPRELGAIGGVPSVWAVCVQLFGGPHNSSIRFEGKNRNVDLLCLRLLCLAVLLVQTGRCVRTIEGAHPHFVTCIQAHPVAPIVVSGGVDKSIKIWGCK